MMTLEQASLKNKYCLMLPQNSTN